MIDPLRIRLQTHAGRVFEACLASELAIQTAKGLNSTYVDVPSRALAPGWR